MEECQSLEVPDDENDANKNKCSHSENDNIFTNHCKVEDTDEDTDGEPSINLQNTDENKSENENDDKNAEKRKTGQTRGKYANIKDDMNAYMLRACEKGRSDIVEKLLERDPNLLQAKDSDNYTPLHRSVYSGQIEIVKLLLLNKAKVDASTIDGWQPLHCACRWSQTDIAFLLIQNGADVNARTEGGLTPLHLAAATSCTAMLQMLLTNRYLNWNVKNGANETAYQISKSTCKGYILFEMTEDQINLLK
ncbi:ankyrin repeat domain-containing protein 49-like [Argonauta hians]